MNNSSSLDHNVPESESQVYKSFFPLMNKDILTNKKA